MSADTTDIKASPAPGPWRVVEGPHYGRHPDFPQLEYLSVESRRCARVTDELSITTYMRRVDANLIAAAPELLALAKQYASECSECEGRRNVGSYTSADGGLKQCEDCADIWAVIDKAEGRS